MVFDIPCNTPGLIAVFGWRREFGLRKSTWSLSSLHLLIRKRISFRNAHREGSMCVVMILESLTEIDSISVIRVYFELRYTMPVVNVVLQPMYMFDTLHTLWITCALVLHLSLRLDGHRS